MKPDLVGTRQHGDVTRGEEVRFTVRAACPDRTDRVDHPPCWQIEPGCHLGLAGFASTEQTTCLQQSRPSGAVNGAVDPTPAEQRCVRGVDDRVDILHRDVADHHFEASRAVSHSPVLLAPFTIFPGNGTPPDHTGHMAERLLTPSKITAWLDCAHFLTLQHQLDAGTLVVERSPFGEMAALLLQKGMDHEAAVLDGYRAEGKSVFEVPAQDKERGESFAAWVERVGNPMADGHDVVFQMPFVHDGIRGIADFLVRIVDPDTGAVTLRAGRRQARPQRGEAGPRAAAVLLRRGAHARSPVSSPTHVRIALGSGQVETIRVDDVLPYWRRLRGQLAKLIDAPTGRRHVPRAVRPLPVLRVRDGVRSPVARRRLARPRRRRPPGRSGHAASRPRRHDRPPRRARPGIADLDESRRDRFVRQAKLQVGRPASTPTPRRRSSC